MQHLIQKFPILENPTHGGPYGWASKADLGCVENGKNRHLKSHFG